jgi:hypothetical protein
MTAVYKNYSVHCFIDKNKTATVNPVYKTLRGAKNFANKRKPLYEMIIIRENEIFSNGFEISTPITKIENAIEVKI